MWIAVALVGFCCVALIAFAAVAFSGFKTVMRGGGCVITMTMARNSIDAYVRVNGKFPPADTWQTDTEKYYAMIYNKIAPKFKQNQIISEMLDVKPGQVMECTMGEAKSGLAYNADLAGKTMDDIKDKEATVVIFETTTATQNNNAPYKPLTGDAPKMFGSKRSWLTLSVAGRKNTFQSRGGDTNYSISDEDLELSDEELGIKPKAGKEGSSNEPAKAEGV